MWLEWNNHNGFAKSPSYFPFIDVYLQHVEAYCQKRFSPLLNSLLIDLADSLGCECHKQYSSSQVLILDPFIISRTILSSEAFLVCHGSVIVFDLKSAPAM